MVCCRVLTQSRKARDVVVGRVAAEELAVPQQRFRVDFHLARVAGLDLALFALEPHGARPEPQAGADDQLHAVRVTPDESVALAPELDGAGVVGVVGPLAQVHGVAAPFRDRAAAEVPVCAPEAARRVFCVVRAPLGRSQPAVPVELLARRLRLGGQDGVVARFEVPPASSACSSLSRPSLPLRARFTAKMKWPTLRRCVPHW